MRSGKNTLILALICAFPLWSQADVSIQHEFQAAMSLGAPPEGGGELGEEEARQRAERFQAELAAFVERWQSRVAELDAGRLVLAKALALTGRPTDAVPLFRAWIKAHGDSPECEEARLRLGTALLDAGEAAEASRELRSFLSAYPASERRHVASYYLAIAAYRQGATEEALSLLREVLASGQESPLVGDAHIKYIHILRDEGRADEARAHLAGLIEQNPDAAYLLTLKEQLEWLGREAPELVDIDTWIQGEPVTLAQLRGQVVVLNFFADRYEACQAELEHLAGLEKTLRGRGVRFIALTKFYRPLDKVPEERQVAMMREFLDARGVAFLCGMANSFENLRNYEVRGVPQTVVIGRDGKVVHVKYGSRRGDAQGLQSLREAIEGAGRRPR
jgi:TolA-binding protein/peroxiredoxin